MQAIIILPATSRYSPAKIGNFIFSEEFGAHIWGGRPLDMEEFNEISKRIFYSRRNEIEDFDLPPYVQMVEAKAESGKRKAETSEIFEAKPKLKRKTPLIPIPELTV
jgi:hypothetical protein